MTHEFASQLLAAYVDGVLPLGDAASVRAHLAACPTCSTEVSGLEELNRALALPPAPPVAFHAFWAGIEKRLPRRAATRPVRVVRPALALAFVLAALLAVTTAASAFASDRILPDSPLYSLKVVGENVRIDLALGQRDRTQLTVQLAAERLREAKAMAGEQKNQLAVASLRSFQSLLADASTALQHPAPAERQETLNTIGNLDQALTEVEQAASKTADEADAEVEAIVQTSRASLAQDEQDNQAPSQESTGAPQSSDTGEPQTQSAAPERTTRATPEFEAGPTASGVD